MFERFTTVNKSIEHALIISFKGFRDDSDKFLKNAPNAIGDGKLDGALGSFVIKSSNGLICLEALDCAKNVVLEHCNRYTCYLGGEVSGLGFTKQEQAFAFLEQLM